MSQPKTVIRVPLKLFESLVTAAFTAAEWEVEGTPERDVREETYALAVIMLPADNPVRQRLLTNRRKIAKLRTIHPSQIKA